MAHFAKLGKGNKVMTVEIVSNDIATTEQAGIDFLNNLYGTNDVWKQTSYNTRNGVHQLGGTPFRKNYAGMGDKYDETRDAFIAPKPFNSWILNETTCKWEAPVEKPLTYINNLKDIDNNPFPDYYTWNETTKQWDLRND
tara:strand:+ start:1218 stop:1637 length:420 start_codon:yes stop_codon:yes gene_type:complete